MSGLLVFSLFALVLSCPPGKTLSDCSVSRVKMPLLPADTQYAANDEYHDAHPLFPRDDVLDIVVESCNGTFAQNKYTPCFISIRSSQFNVSTAALLKPHGGDMINFSFRVKFAASRLFGQKGFILKDTQDSDPSFLRERLSALVLRYAGAKVQRECFARLRVKQQQAKTVVVEELIDEQFAHSRFGVKEAGVWKAGGNHAVSGL